MQNVKEEIKKSFNAEDDNFFFASSTKKPENFKTLQILLRYCIFPHSYSQSKTTKKVDYTFHKTIGGATVKSYLAVEADRGDFLNPFDRDLLYTLHLHAQKLLFGETYIFVIEAGEICKLLGVKSNGQAYKRIQESLRRLMRTTIRTNMLFPIEHRIDETLIAEFKLISGYIYDRGKFYIDLSAFSRYLTPRYMKSIPYNDYINLNSSVAKHAYGMLKVFFEGDNKDVFSMNTAKFLKYCLLDHYLKMEKKEYTRNMKRTVFTALDELRDKGYFDYKLNTTEIKFRRLEG